MSGPARPSLESRPAQTRGRPLRIAWVPAIAMSLVAATPLLQLWCFDNLTLREMARDFGLKLGPASQRTFDFLMWYGPGFGWVYAVVAVATFAFVLPQSGRWADVRDRRDVAIWLLAAACASLVMLLGFSRTANGIDEMQRVLWGITSGGSSVPPTATP